MTLIGPADFEKNFAARAKNQGKFDAIVVGAWQAGPHTPSLFSSTLDPLKPLFNISLDPFKTLLDPPWTISWTLLRPSLS